MNMQETALLLKQLQAIHREVRIDQDSLQQWQRLLAKWGWMEIQAATDEYNRSFSKAPRPADLIRLAREKQEAGQARRRQEYAGGEEVFRCAYCRDSGLMLFETGDTYELACTPCICRQGGSSRERRIKAMGYVFDFPGFIWRQPQKETWIGDMEAV